MELEKYKYNNSQTKLSTKGHDFTYAPEGLVEIIFQL